MAALVLGSLVVLVIVIATIQLVVDSRRLRARNNHSFDVQFTRVLEGAERACTDQRLIEEARARVRLRHAAGTQEDE